MNDNKNIKYINTCNHPLEQAIDIILNLESFELIEDYLVDVTEIELYHGEESSPNQNSYTLLIDVNNLTNIAQSSLLSRSEFNSLVLLRFCNSLENFVTNRISSYSTELLEPTRIRLADYKTFTEKSLSDVSLSELFMQSKIEDLQHKKNEIKNLTKMSEVIGPSFQTDREIGIDLMCSVLQENNDIQRESDMDIFNRFNKRIERLSEQIALEEIAPPLMLMSLSDFTISQGNVNLNLNKMIVGLKEKWQTKLDKNATVSLTTAYKLTENALKQLSLFPKTEYISDILSYDQDYNRIRSLPTSSHVKNTKTNTKGERNVGLIDTPELFNKWPGDIRWRRRDIDQDVKTRKNTLEGYRLSHTRKSSILRTHEVSSIKVNNKSKQLNVEALLALCYWTLYYHENTLHQKLKKLEKENLINEESIGKFTKRLVDFFNFIDYELLDKVIQQYIDIALEKVQKIHDEINKNKRLIRELESEEQGIPDNNVENNKAKFIIRMRIGKVKEKVKELERTLNDSFFKANNPRTNKGKKEELKQLLTHIIKYHFNYNLLYNIIETYYNSLIGHELQIELYKNKDEIL